MSVNLRHRRWVEALTGPRPPSKTFLLLVIIIIIIIFFTLGTPFLREPKN